jgi:hypothetical protein
MKVLAALALVVVFMVGAARAATFEIVPGYSDQNTDQQWWTAWLFDNSDHRAFACMASWDVPNRKFSAYCAQESHWKSKLPASSNVKTTLNIQKSQADLAVVAWQVDEVTGKAQVCYQDPTAIIDGDNCIDITP